MSDDILDEHIDRLDQQAETIATLEADNKRLRVDRRADRYALHAEQVEVNRLREALPPPHRLRGLAEWFDRDDVNKGRDGQEAYVQDDLGTWADAIEKALEAKP